MFQQYQIKLTTLTPVCIGDGQKLSPFSDYKLERDKLIYIDHNRIKQTLVKYPNLINDYVNGIISGMDNTGNKFDMVCFFYNRAKLDLSSLTLKRIDSTAQPKGNKNLYTILKQAGKYPYIPGSSLKGAIKTALIYNWLLQDNNHWCKEYLELFDNNKRLPLSELKDKKEKYEDNLKNQLLKYELSVSDSNLFSEESIKAIDTKRLHLKEGKFIIPQTWESIKKNNITTFTISKIFENKKLIYEWSDICNKINAFTLNSNNIEWEIFDTCGAKNDKLSDDIYNDLFSFYKKMDDKVKNADSSTCYLRLGNGKGYYFNSIGLNLYNEDKTESKNLFINFLRDNGFGKIYNRRSSRLEDLNIHADEFPLTRVVDVNNNTPSGWVKMELLKEKKEI